MRPAGRSSSTSVMGARRSRRSWPARPAGWPTRTAATFTTEPLEAYATEVAAVLPVDDPAIYPVSGGSEAIETALKLVRAYHLARGEPDRDVVIARHGSYHGNTLGALDLSGRPPLRRPYEPWLGRFRHVSAAYPYRAGEAAAHALGDGAALAAELDARHHRGGSRSRGRLRRGAHRRGDARRGGATGRLLAGHRGGLLAPRRAARRRRGHDRVRPDGTLVRPGSLGRPAGPARRGQGRHLGLLAVRVRRGGGARVRDRDRPGRRLRPRVHVLARAGRGGGRAGGPAHPPRRGPGGCERQQGRPAARAPARTARRPSSGSARSAAAD